METPEGVLRYRGVFAINHQWNKQVVEIFAQSPKIAREGILTLIRMNCLIKSDTEIWIAIRRIEE